LRTTPASMRAITLAADLEAKPAFNAIAGAFVHEFLQNVTRMPA